MKILITGNMGYVGPVVVDHLRTVFPDAVLIGYDMAYFAPYLTNVSILPEAKLNMQLFGDVRSIPPSTFQGVDCVVHLAAISNDPMGNKYEDVTLEINHKSSIKLAQMAKDAGVSSFVFASSCSMYGSADDSAKTERATLNPLTAYARSKVFTEKELEILADENFIITCLRFATACGMSDRLRLDLVLNDFVAGAVANGKINILSDGSPWRPLIHVKDMARAIEWAIHRKASLGGNFLAINTGSDSWNFQVKDLAKAVVDLIPGTSFSINKDAPPDKRSYKVDFNFYKSLAPNHQPLYTLEKTILELYQALTNMKFGDNDFRNSLLMRLKVLTSLQESNKIDHELKWIDKKIKPTEKTMVA